MMDTDRGRFTASYFRLSAAHQHKPDDNECLVYWDSLMELPIEAVEGAERTLRTEGSVTAQGYGHLPISAEWYDVAAGLADQAPVVRSDRALPPAPDDVKRELRAIQRARNEFLRALEAQGWTGVAALIRAIPIRHPGTDPQAPYCRDCDDTGFAEVKGQWATARPCACVEMNPTVQRRRRIARLVQLQAARRARVLALRGAWAVER